MTQDEATSIVNTILAIGAGVTRRGDEIKCYVPTEEGDRCKTYIGWRECRALEQAFGALAGSLVIATKEDGDV